jgi:hypothetical protein
MNEQEFLAHHGLSRNPFSQEDASTDSVFREHCLETSFHPAWDKVCGDPDLPATALVLGAKGAGKTAMRLQLVRHYQQHNQQHPNRRVFVVQYDDFNSQLGALQQRLLPWRRSKPHKVLAALRLTDHLDAILQLAVTRLVDQLLGMEPAPGQLKETILQEAVDQLDRDQRRDLLLLAALYDQPEHGTYANRWKRLRRQLNFGNLATWYSLLTGGIGSLLALLLVGYLVGRSSLNAGAALGWLVGLLLLVWSAWLWRAARYGWIAWRASRGLRMGRRELSGLWRALMAIPTPELAAQPVTLPGRIDDRYSLLNKLQLLLRSLGYPSLIVLMDRVDEPDLVHGHPDRMRCLVWPLLDNKLLKHPGLGIKALLPIELQFFLDRESREFHERARLDKQNLITNFNWTGQALYDLVASRLKACATGDRDPQPVDLFAAPIDEARLMVVMQELATPRRLCRFMYQLVSEHCKQHRSSQALYQITPETFESVLAVLRAQAQSASS